MQRIEDIRDFFGNPKQRQPNEVPEENKRSSKKMKRVMMLDSDEEDAQEVEPAKKQLKETSSTSASKSSSKTSTASGSEPKKIMLTTADDFFGSTSVKQKKRPIDQSKKDPKVKFDDSGNNEKAESIKDDPSKNSERVSPKKKPSKVELDVISVHEDKEFRRDILEAANDPLVSLEQNSAAIPSPLAKIPKKKSTVEKVGENKSPPTTNAKTNSGDKVSASEPHPKTPISSKTSNSKDHKSSNAKDEKSPTKTPVSMTKQASKSSFWTYQNRQGPQNLGSKTLPKGPDNCLEGKSFVLTGILESFERDDIKAFIERHGGKVVTNVSSKTSYVVVGRDPGESKVTKAQSLGTPVLDEDGLLNLVSDVEVKEIVKMEKVGKEKQKTSPNKSNNDEKPKETMKVELKPSQTKPVIKNEEDTSEFKASNNKNESKTTPNSINIPKKVSPKKLDASEKSTVQTASNSKSPVKSQIASGTTEVKPGDSELWVDKYQAKTMKQIIGQQGEKSNARKLHHWLQNWHACFTHRNYKGPTNKENGLIFKAALLSGVAGIGKTTTATVVSKDLGFEMICMNASDTRSQKMLNTVVAETLKSGTLTSIMSSHDIAEDKADLKHVLIMDEVDGMAGNEDRGGMRELIALIGKSKIPVICICNDRQHMKVRSLANHCFDLKFQRPRVEQLKGAMMSMCFKEGLKVQPNALEQMIIGANQDIRQIIHHLQAWFTTNKTLNYDEAREKAKSAKKDQKMGPFDACRAAFCYGEERRKMSMNDKMDLFFYDYSLMPLFMQENYLQTSMNRGNSKDTLAALSKAADSFVAADLSSKLIRTSNNWSLLPKVGMYSCVIPGELCQGGMGQFVSFPQWLGQNSKRSKNDRCLQVISPRFRNSFFSIMNSLM